MTQNTRNKMAFVLAVVLVPTMVYLMVSNVREARRRARPAAQPPDAAPALAVGAAMATLSSVPPPTEAAPAIVKEQKRIANQRPTRSPFFPPAPPAGAATPAPRTPPPEDEAAIASRLELNGILFGKTTDSRTAIINGKMLGEGRSVAGYTIVTIDTSAVTLERGTNRITLRLKQ